jgi:membrane protein
MPSKFSSDVKESPSVNWAFLLILLTCSDFWRCVLRRFKKYDGFDATAILSYSSLISIVPMMAIMLSVFSVSEYFAVFQDLVMEYVVVNLLPSTHANISLYLMKFSQQAVQLKVPGLVLMLISTLFLLWKIDSKLNQMWSDGSKRRWWSSLSHYLGISLIGPLLVGGSLFLSSMIAALTIFPFPDDLFVWVHINQFLPWILAVIGFTLLFIWIPAHKVAWNAALVTALMAATELELLKVGFSVFLKWFPSYDVIYGAFAAIPVFLLWLYLFWWIVLFNGAVLAEMVESHSKSTQGFVK